MANDPKQDQQEQSGGSPPAQGGAADPKLTASPREGQRADDPKQTGEVRHVNFNEDRPKGRRRS